MAEQEINFRKVREFGDNLNDTFLFIKQNLKGLLGAFFGFCGIFMLGKAIFSGLYESRSFGFLDRLGGGFAAGGQRTAISEIFTPEYFLIIFFSWLTFVSMRVVLAAYIKFYVENDGLHPSMDQVWVYFKKYFFRVFFYSIPIWVLIIIGTLFCLLPGIYLAVVFTAFDMVLVIEDATMGEAFNRCFLIIKDQFWISLAIYLVALIIYSFGGMIISLLIGGLVGLATYFTTKSIGTTAGVVTSFLNIFSGVFYIVFFVSSAFQYFNLAERHDGTGILQRIDALGGDQSGSHEQIPEEY